MNKREAEKLAARARRLEAEAMAAREAYKHIPPAPPQRGMGAKSLREYERGVKAHTAAKEAQRTVCDRAMQAAIDAAKSVCTAYRLINMTSRSLEWNACILRLQRVVGNPDRE